jgi:hypothetical protein
MVRSAVLAGSLVGVLLTSAAYAGVPDRVAHVYAVDDTVSVKRLQWSSDGAVLVGATGSGRVFAWDADTHALDTANGCDAAAAAVVPQSSGPHLVYVGCDDGALHTLEWDGLRLSVHDDESGDPEVIDLTTRPIIGVWIASDGRVYALAEGAGDALRLFDWDPATGDTNHFATTVELFKRDFREGALVKSTAGDVLYVSHGGNDFSQVLLASGATTSTLGAALSVEVDDVAAAPLSGGSPYGLLVADPNRGVVRWNGTSGIGLSQPITVLDGSISKAHAIAVQYNSGRTAPENYFVQSGSTIEAYGTLAAGSPTTTSFAVDFRVVDLVEGPYGYILAGTDDGDLAVMTAKPWVDEMTMDPQSGPTGTEVTVTFHADTAGTWKVMHGGTRDGGGTQIATGTLAEAGTVTTKVTVDSTWGEGVIKVYATVTDGGETGHARATFDADNTPPQVRLSNANVGFGDSAIVLDFPVVDAADIDRYEVYISTDPFTATEWPTGGPTSTKASGLVSPVSIVPEEDGSRVQTRIEGLDNYVVYYLAARAIDASGKEGPMSNVVEETPQPTYSGGELVGEDGGPAGCASTGGPLLGLASVGALLAARRRGVAALLALLALGAASPAAHAEETRSRGLSRFDRDISPAWTTFQFRHDFQQFGFKNTDNATQKASWDDLRSVYGPWASVLRVEVGPQIFRVFEVNFGVGFMSHKGDAVGSGSDASAEQVRMQWFPLSIGGTLRAHILDEQPVVPFVNAGVDWVFYREDTLSGTDVDKAARLIGSKSGWHWAAGGDILLDTFSPSRAARLEAGTGINDTWLTLRYSQQRVGPNGGGFDFSGWAFGIGLKLDY